MKPFTGNIDPENHRYLARAKQATGCSKAEIVRRALYLYEQQFPYKQPDNGEDSGSRVEEAPERTRDSNNRPPSLEELASMEGDESTGKASGGNNETGTERRSGSFMGRIFNRDS